MEAPLKEDNFSDGLIKENPTRPLRCLQDNGRGKQLSQAKDEALL